MGLLQNIARRLPTTKGSLHKLDNFTRRVENMAPRLAFFNRRVRLTGNSSISIPLGILILFPFLVIVLISVLFMRSPDPEGIMRMPAGTPPSIR
jgi:mannosyltransferase